MIRRIIFVVTVLVVFGSVPFGLAAPAEAQHSDTTDSGGVFGTNVSVSSNVEAEADEFKNATQQIEKAAEDLNETVDTINRENSYTDTSHERANVSLSEIEHGIETLRDAESEATSNMGSLTSAEQFILLREMDREKSAALETANNALEQYERAVKEKRDNARSTVDTYFGGGFLIGLFGGLILGAVVPLVEARNVRDQMKLSRDVSYNRRAALIPAVVGIVLFVCGIGLLWYLGAIDLVRVIV